MNKLRIARLVLLVLLLFVAFPNTANSTGTKIWQGYVIDRQCAESVRQDSDPVPFIKHHTKDCSLMPNCRAIGYSLYSQGKWFDLDKKGNSLTIRLLRTTQKRNNFYVQAVGRLQGKVLQIESMKELDEPQKSEKH